MRIKSLLLYILILSPALLVLILFCRTIFKPGYIIYTDVTEPLNISRLYEKYFFTYSNDIGESLAEKSRIPLFLLVFGIQKALNLASENFIKIKFLLLLVLNTISFIWCLSVVTKGKIKDKSFLFSAIIGSVFFNINYWATNRLAHFHLFFSTVTVCVTFALYYKFLFLDHRYRNLLILSVLLAALIGTPHTVLLVFLTIGAINISALLSKTQIGLKKALLGFLIFTLSFTAVSLYWILPFLYSKSTPDAILSPEIFNLLSRNATLLKSAILQGYWWKEPSDYLSTLPFLKFAGVANTIGLAIITLLFIVKRGLETKKLPLLVVLILSILLGSKNLISTPIYDYLMFSGPLKSFGWLFRELDKIILLSAFSYSAIITILLKKETQKKYGLLAISKMVLIYLVVLGTLVNPALFFIKTIKENYTPQTVPQDFKIVNDLLKADKEEFNTLWFPSAEKTYWLKTSENRFVFSNLVSEKPAVTTRSDTINLVEYLLDPDNIAGINVGKALDFIGVKYLIVRKDSKDYLGSIVDERINRKNDPGLRLLYSGDSLSIYENRYFSGLTKVGTNAVVTNEGMDVFKDLDAKDINPANTIILFADGPTNQLKTDKLKTKYLCEGENYLDFTLNSFLDKFIFPADYVVNVESGKADRWRKSSLFNFTHAENKFFFKNYGINTNQLDYQKMVTTALDGSQLTDPKLPGSPVDAKILFSNHPNAKIVGDKVLYKSSPEDFKYYWDIIRSDKFVLGKDTSLRVRFESKIPKELVPHFKITFYDEQEKELSIKFIYSNELGSCDEIVKIPTETLRADFSIWTLSKTDGTTYTYEISLPKLEDVTANTQNLSLSFAKDVDCVGACTVYARVLESGKGGLMSVNINGQGFDIKTAMIGSLSDRFNWKKVGIINLQKGSETKIVLENKQGINSVNALVFLQEEESRLMEKETVAVEAQCVAPTIISSINGETTLPSSSELISSQINPTKYRVASKKTDNISGVLLFAKPYSKNWVAGEDKSLLVNGVLNGWNYQSNLKELTIEYLPQRFFYLGSISSAISILALLAILRTRRH